MLTPQTKPDTSTVVDMFFAEADIADLETEME